MSAGSPIATLSFINECSGETAADAIGIWPKQEIILGSKHVQQHLLDRDSTISRNHLTLRCVLFDEDAARWNVSPMVYAEDSSLNGTVLSRDCSTQDGTPVRLNHKLTKSVGPVLLQDGDRLYFSKSIFVQYQETNPDDRNNMSLLMSREVQHLDDFYVVPRLIGIGGHGKIYVAWDQKALQQVACKVVSLAGVSLKHDVESAGRTTSHIPEQATSLPQSRPLSQKIRRKIHSLEAEYDVLKDLNHPNIIDMRKVFITTHYIYIMQELMAGGDLFSFIIYKGGLLTESLSAVITHQLLKAVKYLHENSIVHRDIKPENVLMTSWRENARIVLTDFGMAKRIDLNEDSTSQPGTRFRMFSMCGTTGFSAPEVFKLNPTIAKDKGYSSAIDMWSIGTVTALMLTGNLAFETRPNDDNPNSPSAYDLSMIDQAKHGWKNVPRRARNFVRSLLVLQEDQRLSAKAALQHHWFTNPTCAATFEAIYAQSISGWKPRTVSGEDTVVEMDTSDLIGTPRSGLQEALSTPIQSQFFAKQAQKKVHDDKITASAPSDDRLTKPNNTLQASNSRQASSSFPWPSSHNHIHHNTNAPHQTSSQQSSIHSLNASLPSYVPPRSSNPEQDRDTLDPAYGARAAEPSMELSWPSSPPNRKKRLPSSEFTWPSQKESRRSRV